MFFLSKNLSVIALSYPFNSSAKLLHRNSFSSKVFSLLLVPRDSGSAIISPSSS
ncbi:hypothetical protein CTL0231A [Chlamydia trachomatis L2/434/Bu]|uniref:Uncharacterized protein n=2 Tax=Chlamydia trachomatis TaxID=813 RepID=A0A6H2W0H8_CHLTB|nr:hypothetical protein L2bCS78408_01255 [Chlamydia trachomatis]AKC31129.1 hypothetical protein L2bCS1908_01255 [Chlamydia trachomatis]CAP03674.1 hypothetical protein CTL0231A [Chlamydia trachomatis 434/Bu]CAP06628.1 hypothetical protein CTLon_0230 [Chlamydia trachomatis L2b/UCH-1/proctitis]